MWPGMIPLGKVTLLLGDPGIGKSLLAVDLAARITRGKSIPPARKKRDPGRVLFLAGDGETEDLLPGRLAAFGADLERVAGIEAAENGKAESGERKAAKDDEEGVRFFSLRYDVERLDLALTQWRGCELVVIDPVSAFLDGVDANSIMPVRRMMMRLSAIARRYNTAILMISHFRKAVASTLLYRGMGSIAFTLATSVVLTLAADRGESGRRLLLPAKMNPLPEAEQHGRAFSIGLNKLTWDPERVLIAPDELRDLSTLGMNVDQRVEAAARWLQSILLGKKIRATLIAEAAREQRIPMKVLYAARKLAKARIVRDGQEGVWYWKLEPTFVIQDWEW